MPCDAWSVSTQYLPSTHSALHLSLLDEGLSPSTLTISLRVPIPRTRPHLARGHALDHHRPGECVRARSGPVDGGPGCDCLD